jgi:Protein of unknown function (DUF3037)
VPAADADQVPFSYVILRAVPSVERGERINVGVVLFCRQRRFLGVRWEVDPARLAALRPQLDGVAADGVAADGVTADRTAADGVAAGIEAHLRALARVAAGDPCGGPVAALDQSDRFGWLAAPSSTIVQPSRVHTGLCEDPDATLASLFERLVQTASHD